MIEPRIRPANMSVNQWALRYILEKLIARMVIMVVVLVIIELLFMNMYTIMPRNTTAIVTWPLGNEKPVSRTIGFGGRATRRISFEVLVIAAVIRIIDNRKKLCFFCDFERR